MRAALIEFRVLAGSESLPMPCGGGAQLGRVITRLARLIQLTQLMQLTQHTQLAQLTILSTLSTHVSRASTLLL